eukprot:1448311-Rhodomonas_salina.3
MCLAAVGNLFQRHIDYVNMDNTASLRCPRTFLDMAVSVYGGAHEQLITADSVDALRVQSLTDSKVLRAAAALQAHVNDVRSEECPDMSQLTGRPEVVYAERGEVSEGFGQYRLEVKLGSKLFTGRVAHMGRDEQYLEPEEEEEDPRNLLGRFVLLRVSPEPCAQGADSELAVTKNKVQEINGQSLSWRAAFRHDHEGVVKSQFATGYIRPSKVRSVPFVARAPARCSCQC